ncbi:MAG TPA: ComF family protein [Clostridia bacterium]|nr:ComF family protein [Clostridia bacterium]
MKLKYDQEWHLFEPLGQAMVSVASLELPPADVVIPVPMYELKEIARGMNHAYGLARVIAKALGLTLLRDGLVRTKNTPPLSDLTKQERQQTVTEGFRVPGEMVKAIKGKRIWLVDDVLTTGATAGECSKALLRAGALRVCVITAARSLKHT